jgi:hypothetical protein
MPGAACNLNTSLASSGYCSEAPRPGPRAPRGWKQPVQWVQLQLDRLLHSPRPYHAQYGAQEPGSLGDVGAARSSTVLPQAAVARHACTQGLQLQYHFRGPCHQERRKAVMGGPGLYITLHYKTSTSTEPTQLMGRRARCLEE